MRSNKKSQKVNEESKKSLQLNVNGAFHSRFQNIKNYFALKSINKQLTEENTALKNRLENIIETSKENEIADFTKELNNIHSSNFKYLTANLIKITLYHSHNIFVLDKGKKHGIKPDMGVITFNNSVIGIVKNCSENYSTVLPIINKDFKVSIMLKNSKIPSILSWDGKDYRYSNVENIPMHIAVSKGDTVFTSNYSNIFKDRFKIGIVESFDAKTVGGFYNIRIKLITDFSTLNTVYVLENKLQKERFNLESLITYE